MGRYATATVVPVAAERTRQVDRWFYVAVAVLIILFNAVAFGPSILDQSRRNVPLPLTPLVAAHAFVSAAWLFLFLAQTTLVATGWTAIHRRVGIAGAALTVTFVVLGWFTTIEQARRGFDLSGDISRLAGPQGAGPVEAIVGLLFFVLTFAILVGAALWYRHRPRVHKRLMLLAVLGGLTPTPVAHVIGHWPVLQPWAGVIFPGSLLVFLSLSAIHDRLSEGRVHPVSVWGALLVFVWNALFNVAIVPSAPWREFATWLIQ
jgi:uncharacterized membrane protein YozB (DUF420 family)